MALRETDEWMWRGCRLGLHTAIVIIRDHPRDAEAHIRKVIEEVEAHLRGDPKTTVGERAGDLEYQSWITSIAGDAEMATWGAAAG